MLLSDTAKVLINMGNIEYYRGLGYSIETHIDKDKHERVPKNTYIDVYINDLPLNSTSLVNIKCDYCNKIFSKKYRDYNRQKEHSCVNKDACYDCRSKKMNDNYIEKYGTKSKSKLAEICHYKTGRNTKYTIDDVRNILEEKGLVLIEDTDEIITSHKISYMCKKHEDKGIQHRTLDQIMHSDTCCKYGGYEMRSGENNNRWKGGITSKKEKIRKSDEYKEWRNSVFERDNYTCQCCGDSTGGNLQAHHKYNFSEYPELRFDVDNGITLCKKCHDFSQLGSFHYVYGATNNTPEQLEEYINDYQKQHKINT